MGRLLGPSCKLCRREGEKLFLKGARCESPKCALMRKNYAPGMHGNKGSFGQKSEYSKQLREKQKAKRIFSIHERQFHNYYKMAEKRPGITGDVLLQILECRIDNAVYKGGFAASRAQARQMVSHGLLKLNGKKVSTPSIILKVGSLIEATEKAKKNKALENLEKQKIQAPKWLKVDIKKPSLEVVAMPDKNDFQQGISAQMIVELYSK